MRTTPRGRFCRPCSGLGRVGGRTRGALPPAREVLVEAADALLEAAAAGVPEELLEALLDDVPDDLTPEEMNEILARRTFAVGAR